MQPVSSRSFPPAWLVLWVCALLWAIFQHGPLPFHSTRTLGIAWEMWNQAEFLVPHANGVPYGHDAPLVFWLIQLGWTVFGVSDIWPRVLLVLISGAWLYFSARLARAANIGRPSAAALMPWLLIALPYPFFVSLQIMGDVLLALWVTCALYALNGRPRWHWFALAIAGGLLTKGVAMLLGVVFPWLLGAWWSDVARRDRRAWYGYGLLAIVAGVALLSLWAVPAGIAGGEDYRRELLLVQAAGRFAESSDRSLPYFWYLPMLFVLALPWAAWPRMWHAVITAQGPATNSERFAISWLAPTFVVFLLISDKPIDELMPLMPAGAMLLAAAIGRQQARVLGTDWRWRPWPIAAAITGVALLFAALPIWCGYVQDAPHWVADADAKAPWFSALFLGLGVVCLTGDIRYELQRIAICTLLATTLIHTVFVQSLFHHVDLRPAAAVLAGAQADGRAIANVGRYDEQFHFLARLTHPVKEIDESEVNAWATANPNGLIVLYPAVDNPANRKSALLVQPFRYGWIEIWEAKSLMTYRQPTRP